tara:strand:+ start:1520 stop:1921 length:402 start_codon:yes stop_codon:yes gene_type:complete
MAGTHNDDEIISGINVTPLVDVMLVLLVIFMVSAPVIYQSAIKVDLPSAQTGEKSPPSENLEFAIKANGDLYFGKLKMSWESLEQKLKATAKYPVDQAAIISADKSIPHGTVIRLMDLLRQVGLSKIGLNVTQ